MNHAGDFRRPEGVANALGSVVTAGLVARVNASGRRGRSPAQGRSVANAYFEETMELATWVPIAVVAIALFDLLLLGLLDERQRPDAASVSGSDPSEGAGGGGSDADADLVRCRECGAENEREYRYCRHCVSELPGGTTIGQDGTGPIGGLG